MWCAEDQPLHSSLGDRARPCVKKKKKKKKGREIPSFTTIGVELEIIMLSEISQEQKVQPCMFSLIRKLKKS